MSSDMNLFDLLGESFLKEDVKDEMFDHDYGSVITVSVLSFTVFPAIPFAKFPMHYNVLQSTPCVMIGLC